MPSNRGKALEKTIMQLFKRYEQLNIHCQQNHAEKLSTGQTVRKHGFDFQIFYKGKFIAFDAKNCQGERFSITTNCKIHQIKALHDIQLQGGDGFFLVYFENQGLNILSADYIIDCLEQGIKSVKFDQSKKTNLDILGVFTNDSNRPN